MICVFGYAALATNRWLFTGVSAATTLTGSISTTANTVGLCAETADTTFQWLTVNSAGTSVKTNTGVTPTVNAVYRYTIRVDPNSTTIYHQLDTLGGITVTATTSAGQPATNTALYPHLLAGSGTSGVATDPHLVHWQAEFGF